MKFTIGLLVAAVLLGTVSALAVDDNRKVEEVIGTVVAHDLMKAQEVLGAMSVEGSVIIRVEEPGEAGPRYIRVDFRYRGDTYPKEIVKSVNGRKRLRLRLIRTRERDEPLEEYIIYPADSLTGEKRRPIWEFAPGRESEKLPYGETLASYAVVKGGIKLVSGE